MNELSYLELKNLMFKKSRILTDEFDLDNWNSDYNETLKLYSNLLEDLNKDLVYFDRNYGFNNDVNFLDVLGSMVVDEIDKSRLENLLKKVRLFLLFLNNN